MSSCQLEWYSNQWPKNYQKTWIPDEAGQKADGIEHHSRIDNLDQERTYPVFFKNAIVKKYRKKNT